MRKSNYIDSNIYKSKEKIIYFRKMVNLSICPYQKQYYNQLLFQELKKLNQLSTTLKKSYAREIGSINQRKFTIEELAQYDGSNGKPAYVAVICYWN